MRSRNSEQKAIDRLQILHVHGAKLMRSTRDLERAPHVKLNPCRSLVVTSDDNGCLSSRVCLSAGCLSAPYTHQMSDEEPAAALRPYVRSEPTLEKLVEANT